jgi:hypothetical protein
MIRFTYDKAYRQGEILFFKCKKGSIEAYGKEVVVPSGVIRTGEKEGHEHKAEGNVQLAMFPDTKQATPGETQEQPSEGILKVGKEGAKITHPEHKDIKLPQGEYVVKTQKEATGKHSHQSVRD